ncbi:MAG TPA: glycogen/starch synthase [Candidatus Barnesiella excrementigallinarum]|nr:glycogen/starch synthase [Candidatus Barnesiella excrementigallinarum]
MEKQLIPDYIFEVSWEVCNKVGGIYTVLSTKAKTLQKQYKDKIIFIGPDVWGEKPSPYFIKSKTLLKDWQRQAALPQNMKIKVGRWDIPGKPIVILVDFKALYPYKNDLYGEMWNRYGVNSLPAYGDYDEACTFAYASAVVIESFYKFIQGDKYNVVAHFDEWTTGMGLLHIKYTLPKVATLFTTHATSIGRSIAGNGKPLYDYLAGYNGDQMAEELNIVSKHSLEKTAAIEADCFTTVSEITAKECTQLLGRKPDIVTPNGFERNFVPAEEIYKKRRTLSRQRLFDITEALTGERPQKNAFLIATSGRYEYKNKGIDLFIDAAKKISLSPDLEREIVAFILVPAWVEGPRADLKARLANPGIATTPLPAPFITHTLHNYDQDSVVNQIQYLNLNNKPGNRLKIIFIPSYLTGDDGIVDLSYYDLLIGLDATAFPSYYEPWGYTPLESIAFGIPTITTDLSGFGQWINSREEQGVKKSGVKVLHRSDFNFVEISEDLADTILALSHCGKVQRAKIAQAATTVSLEAEWKHFIVHYTQAFHLALKKASLRK